MKTLHTILVFLAGIFISVIGLTIRANYPKPANILLIIGTVIELIGAVLFLYKLFTCPKEKNLRHW